VRTRDAGSDRHPGAESLREANDVGFDPVVMVEGEHLSRAAPSALNFTDDDLDAVFVAYASELFDDLFRGRNVTAFALNDLEHDTRYFFGRSRRLEPSILDPVDHITRNRFRIGRHVVREVPEFIRVRNVN